MAPHTSARSVRAAGTALVLAAIIAATAAAAGDGTALAVGRNATAASGGMGGVHVTNSGSDHVRRLTAGTGIITTVA